MTAKAGTAWVATIADSAGKLQHLRLYHDTDNMFRWYGGKDAEDNTEVSGRNINAAINAARAAWRMWAIEVWSEDNGTVLAEDSEVE